MALPRASVRITTSGLWWSNSQRSWCWIKGVQPRKCGSNNRNPCRLRSSWKLRNCGRDCPVAGLGWGMGYCLHHHSLSLHHQHLLDPLLFYPSRGLYGLPHRCCPLFGWHTQSNYICTASISLRARMTAHIMAARIANSLTVQLYKHSFGELHNVVSCRCCYGSRSEN